MLEGLVNLLSVAAFVPLVAMNARRLHDTGKSGWWQLLFLIPIVSQNVMIVFVTQKSDTTENQYGPAPIDPTTKSSAKQSTQTERNPVEPAAQPDQTEPSITKV